MEEKYLFGLIRLTASLVLCTFAFTLISILNLAPSPATQRSYTDRKPASVLNFQGGSAEYRKAVDKIADIEVFCGQSGNQHSLPEETKLVRIHGKNCSPSTDSSAETQIINRTNGIGAIVFSAPSNRFTSDYFSLASGENRIWISQSAGSEGSQVQEVQLIRVKE